MEELFLLPSAGHIALHLHSMSSGGGFCSFCSDLISSPASLSLVSILLGIIPAQGLTSRRQKASFPKSLQTQEGDRMLASFPSRLGKEGFSRLSVLNQGRSSAAASGGEAGRDRLRAHSRPTSSSIFSVLPLVFFC